MKFILHYPDLFNFSIYNTIYYNFTYLLLLSTSKRQSCQNSYVNQCQRKRNLKVTIGKSMSVTEKTTPVQILTTGCGSEIRRYNRCGSFQVAI